MANLAEAGPVEIAVAQEYLRNADCALASAAWRFATGFGDTMVHALGTHLTPERPWCGGSRDGATFNPVWELLTFWED